jgi:hypothetical protein
MQNKKGFTTFLKFAWAGDRTLDLLGAVGDSSTDLSSTAQLTDSQLIDSNCKRCQLIDSVNSSIA